MAKLSRLLDCYTGGNLGDGAIQDAVIWNIRQRLPDAAIYGITLHPADTIRAPWNPFVSARRAALPNYHAVVVADPPVQPASADGEQQPTGKESVARCLAKALAAGAVGAARFLLPRGWPWIIRRELGHIRTELSHIIGGYRFLKDVDVLIISGGGQLQDIWGGPWGHPYAMLKWTLLARLRGAKPIFLSIGFSGLDARLSRFFTRKSLSLAAYRSYRDPGSRELMKRAGFHRDDPVFPDLAYSLPLDSYRLDRASRPAGLVVGLSPFCHRHPLWPLGKNRDYSAYEAYIRMMVAIVQWLVAKGYQLSMFTSERNDQVAVADLWAKLTTETSPEVMKSVERHEVTTVRGFIEHAAAVDVVVASRLHGVLLSQLAGTPALALSYERKVDVQMELVGQSSFCLNVDRLQLSEFQECFDRLEANLESARQQIQARFAEFRAQLEVQYDAILLPESRS